MFLIDAAREYLFFTYLLHLTFPLKICKLIFYLMKNHNLIMINYNN
jgi:hypothetical protein